MDIDPEPKGRAVARKTVLQMWAEANDRIELVSPTDLAAELGSGQNVVTILCDTGERYLSTNIFD